MLTRLWTLTLQFLALIPLCLLAPIAACERPTGGVAEAQPGGSPTPTHLMAAGAAPAARASAPLSAASGSTVSGTVTLESVAAGVRLSGEVRGLKPDSVHGFHIHEKGDCSAPDASSAGGHFNPRKDPHGAPDAAHVHLGDLGNIKADAAGIAQVSVIKHGISLTSAANGVLNRSLVVHADPDDLKSQPTGASGARIACGVIRVE